MILLIILGPVSSFFQQFVHPSVTVPLRAAKFASEGYTPKFLPLRHSQNRFPIQTTTSSDTIVIKSSYSLGFKSLAVAFLLMFFDEAASPTNNTFINFPSIQVLIFALFGIVCTIQAYNLSLVLENNGSFTILKRGEQALVEHGLEKYTNNYL